VKAEKNDFSNIHCPAMQFILRSSQYLNDLGRLIEIQLSSVTERTCTSKNAIKLKVEGPARWEKPVIDKTSSQKIQLIVVVIRPYSR
jgi:hypothetical protein